MPVTQPSHWSVMNSIFVTGSIASRWSLVMLLALLAVTSSYSDTGVDTEVLAATIAGCGVETTASSTCTIPSDSLYVKMNVVVLC